MKYDLGFLVNGLSIFIQIHTHTNMIKNIEDKWKIAPSTKYYNQCCKLNIFTIFVYYMVPIYGSYIMEIIKK